MNFDFTNEKSFVNETMDKDSHAFEGNFYSVF